MTSTKSECFSRRVRLRAGAQTFHGTSTRRWLTGQTTLQKLETTPMVLLTIPPQSIKRPTPFPGREARFAAAQKTVILRRENSCHSEDIPRCITNSCSTTGYNLPRFLESPKCQLSTKSEWSLSSSQLCPLKANGKDQKDQGKLRKRTRTQSTTWSRCDRRRSPAPDLEKSSK